MCPNHKKKTATGGKPEERKQKVISEKVHLKFPNTPGVFLLSDVDFLLHNSNEKAEQVIIA